MASYYNSETILYLNGEYVKASEAKMDFYSQSLHYGYGVFEGIRSYKTINGVTKIFKAAAHYERLKRSAELMNLPFHWTVEELIGINYEVLRRNNLQDAYIRPLIYAPANMSFVQNERSFIVLEVWPMGLFLGDKLLKVMTSSFQRPNPKGFKVEAKACGHYVNSILASQEAKAQGYDEALLLDINDYVAEAPGANVFYEKKGKLYTPSLGNILAGITRATVIEICKGLDIEVEEKNITVDELREADAVFYCGTAAEIIGWQSLDGIDIKGDWECSVSKVVKQAYSDMTVEKEFKTAMVLA